MTTATKSQTKTQPAKSGVESPSSNGHAAAFASTPREQLIGRYLEILKAEATGQLADRAELRDLLFELGVDKSAFDRDLLFVRDQRKFIANGERHAAAMVELSQLLSDRDQLRLKHDLELAEVKRRLIADMESGLQSAMNRLSVPLGEFDSQHGSRIDELKRSQGNSDDLTAAMLRRSPTVAQNNKRIAELTAELSAMRGDIQEAVEFLMNPPQQTVVNWEKGGPTAAGTRTAVFNKAYWQREVENLSNTIKAMDAEPGTMPMYDRDKLYQKLLDARRKLVDWMARENRRDELERREQSICSEIEQLRIANAATLKDWEDFQINFGFPANDLRRYLPG